MNFVRTQFAIGVGSLLFALFLWLYAIPNWVSAPGNVRNIVLSPVFWPYVLTGLIGIIGIGLVLVAVKTRPHRDDLAQQLDLGSSSAWFRLCCMAVLIVLYLLAIPSIGMVWASMMAFIAYALLVKTSHPRSVLLAAVIMPLVLYVFFAHVAGVAVPQGEFVRLP